MICFTIWFTGGFRGHPIPDQGCLQGGQRSVLVTEITPILKTFSRKGRRCECTSARATIVVGVNEKKKCKRRCKIPHFRRDKFPHPITFMHVLEGCGNAHDGGIPDDPRSLQSRTEHQSDRPENWV
jgi:hypothetical protein